MEARCFVDTHEVLYSPMNERPALLPQMLLDVSVVATITEPIVCLGRCRDRRSWDCEHAILPIGITCIMIRDICF